MSAQIDLDVVAAAAAGKPAPVTPPALPEVRGERSRLLQSR
jgi:hypothetical protein